MRRIPNIWNLRRVDIERLANFVWKTAVVLLGIRFVSNLVASVLFIYAVREPGMNAHKWTGFDASLSELSSALTLVLELVGLRFAIEVGLRLAGETKPSSAPD